MTILPLSVLNLGWKVGAAKKKHSVLSGNLRGKTFEVQITILEEHPKCYETLVIIFAIRQFLSKYSPFDTFYMALS